MTPPLYHKEALLSYDPALFPFHDIVLKMFEAEGHSGRLISLKSLHLLQEGAMEPGFVDPTKDQQTPFHRTFYNSASLAEFDSLYLKWIREAISKPARAHFCP